MEEKKKQSTLTLYVSEEDKEFIKAVCAADARSISKEIVVLFEQRAKELGIQRTN